MRWGIYGTASNIKADERQNLGGSSASSPKQKVSDQLCRSLSLKNICLSLLSVCKGMLALLLSHLFSCIGQVASALLKVSQGKIGCLNTVVRLVPEGQEVLVFWLAT
eukprot:Gb_23317 [translate_table: standard]